MSVSRGTLPGMATATVVSPREQQREDTRKRIFEAAVDEFRREGFALARVDRIVAAAGVARGTFYFHFPTKEHVLLELQVRHEAAIHARLVAMPRPRSARRLLRQIADALLEETEQQIDRHLFREILALHIRRPIDLDLSALSYLSTQAVQQRFADAARSGILRSDMESGQLAVLLLTSLFGFLASDESDDARRASIDSVLEIFLRGISP